METETQPQEPQRRIGKKQWALIGGAVFVVLAVAALAALLADAPRSPKPSTENILLESKDPFEGIALEAKSVYVLDLRTGDVLFEKNSEAQVPLASLTKTMVALAATDVMPEYALVRISADDLREEGDTGLLRDEEWNIKKLLDFALVVSSNDAIRAIASVAGRELLAESPTSTPDALFVERMNSIAQEIGMNQTYFLNGSGLDLSGAVAGSYGSAEDMARLFAYILENKPELFEATVFDSIEIPSKHTVHRAVNTNKAINHIPNVLASKTGYTELSGGNLVVAFNAGLMDPVIIAVLGSTYEGRFDDMKKLVQATLEAR